MRVIFILAAAAVLLLQSCTKPVTYRSYTCHCVQAGDGAVSDFGMQAKDRGEAIDNCFDIQQRVNDASPGDKVSCNLE